MEGGKGRGAIPRSVSMYGRHTGSAVDINLCSWFNFKPGLDAGRIDSFVCDAMNKKPLCYTVNIREAKSVPKLLRHRMQVRIGTNGLVKMEETEREESEEGYDNENCGMKKVRAGPLSWDEQLNWNEACVRTPRSLQNFSSCGEGLCETRPVIFNEVLEPKHEPRPCRLDSNTRTPAFRVYREPRRVTVDPGSYTNSEKSVSITYVGVEDARDSSGEEIVTPLESKEENIISCRRSDSEDADKLDLSRFDIAQMYSPANDTRKDSPKSTNESTRRPSSLGKLVKKVSFVDEKEKGISTKELTTKEDLDKDNPPTFTEGRVLKSESKDLTDVSNLKKKETRVLRKRPQTSTGIRREKPEDVPSLTICDSDVNVNHSRPRRPYTAPPSSPRLVRDKEEIELFEKWLASVKNRQVIKIPTSTLENGAVSRTPENERESTVKKCSVESMQSVKSGEETFQNSSRIRVSFGSKSAPPRRSPETPTQERCSSSQQRFYTPPPPVVVCSESSAELPKNLPPAQALIALRKKIRDELAQQNQELQLDIQQLFLRKHPS